MVLSGFDIFEEGGLEGGQGQEMPGGRGREVLSKLRGEISNDGKREGISSGGIGQVQIRCPGGEFWKAGHVVDECCGVGSGEGIVGTG